VRTTTPWVNALSLVAKPLFAWNHRVLMSRGEAGLAHRLADHRFTAEVSPARRLSLGDVAGRMPPMLTIDPNASFTTRQRQVVGLIARGCSNVEVADRLGISPRTAKAHSDVLRTKLSVHRRRQIPAAFRELTGEDPHDLTSLAPAAGARGDSRAAD